MKLIQTKLFSPHILGIIVIAQAILIVYLSITINYLRASISKPSVIAAEAEQSAVINQDVTACKQLPHEEAITCAKTTGIKIKSLFISTEEQIKECMKFRPFLVRYCQEGLISQ